jgi:hypothetical protein
MRLKTNRIGSEILTPVVAAGLAILLYGSQSEAAEHEAMCSQQAVRLAQGAGLPGESPVLEGRAKVGRIRIACLPKATRPTVTFSYPSEYPPERFYIFMADIMATAVDHPTEQMRLRAHRCHRAARRTKAGRTHKKFGDLRIDCDRHTSYSSFTLRP